MAGKHGRRTPASNTKGKQDAAKKALKKRQKSSHKFQSADMREKLDGEAQALYATLVRPTSAVSLSSRKVKATVDDLSTALNSGL